jgi:predicted lipoprotein with Yx(FWY)xxD motif
MVTKWYAWSMSIAIVAILATGCDMGKSGSGTCTTSVSTIISAVGVCTPTPAALSPTTMSSSVPASAAPVSSPSASVPMPLSTATLLGTPGFVNGSGFTVYVFDADLAQANASSCNGSCAGVWPAVSPPNGTLPSGWTSFQRQDGTMQLAYKGRALYTYVGDPAPGTTNGDGLTAFGGVWHVARP